jgi:hypothetical protein
VASVAVVREGRLSRVNGDGGGTAVADVLDALVEVDEGDTPVEDG